MLERWRGLEFDALKSWPVFWITLAGNALLPGLLTSQVSGLTVGKRLITMVVTQIVVWCVILGGWLLSTKFRFHGWLVVITALLAAVARGEAISVLFPLLDIGTTSTSLLRILMSAATMGFLILASTAAVSSSQRYHSESRRLSATQEELRASRQEALRLSELEEDRFSERIASSLRAAITGVSGLDRYEAARRIRALGDEQVRPLAHSLVRSLQVTANEGDSQQNTASMRPPAFGTVLVTTLHPAYIRPLPVALACAFVPLAAALNRFGVTQGLIVCVVVFLSILFAALAARALLAPLARPGTVLGVAMLVLAVVLMTMFFALSFTFVTTTPLVTVALAGGVVLTTVTVILAVVHALGVRRAQILMQIAEENKNLAWQIARTNGVRWARQRAMARALHGPIQSALTVAALRLEKADRDESDLHDLTVSTVEWLDGIVKDLASDGERGSSLAERIALVGETWSGQCHSTVEWVSTSPEEVDEDPLCATIIADLVIEGFSNAVRHGRAEKIHVTLERAGPRSISVLIRDDGQRPDAYGESGLGTAYLDDVTIRYTVTREEVGSVMAADVPFLPRKGASE